MEGKKAFIGMPCYTDMCANALASKRAALENGLIGVMPFAVEPAISSSLPMCFNILWAQALAGKFDYFFMLHADIVPQAGWAKVLLDILLEKEADVVSAVSPIKSNDGVFSCAVANPEHTWGPLYRFTAKGLKDMPDTFGREDTDCPDNALLVNTGCWVADLSKPWVRQRDESGALAVSFDMRHRIYVHENGKLEPQMESEDWRFSRQLHELGCRVLATKAVHLSHRGGRGWNNNDLWGVEIDPLANREYLAKRYVSENGYWTGDLPEGHQFDKPLCDALATLFKNTCDVPWVLDIGCGRGDYVHVLRDKGVLASGVDGNPMANTIQHCRRVDVTYHGSLGGHDWTLCLEVGEHIPANLQDALLEKIADCRIGAVVSWAQPGQAGIGHVNCKTPEEVVALLAPYGLVPSTETEQLRTAATLSYFKKNVLVFRKA